ncbi:MAG TPA: hypothetical protein VFF98_10585 [Novosphingobium sp.]|nr:hypothetical protein [Novosphingobium sp.]HZV09728.1 hypothetical protein [Novosphingobium sp.]
MGLFKSDLYRSFAIGFVLGAIGICVLLGPGAGSGAGNVVPAAVAAPSH